jgi:hypothetical protein
VPVGSGTSVLSYHLAREISKSIAFVTSFRQIQRKLENNISEYGLNIASVENADIIICHYLIYKDRKIMQEQIKDNQIVISFIRAGQEIEAFENDNIKIIKLENQEFMIFKTKRLIDIRDVFFASNEEKAYIENCILKERLKKAEEENSFLRKMIEMQNAILSCMGVPTERLQASLKLLDEKKRSTDTNDELQIQKLQNEIVEELEKLTDECSNQLSQMACQNYLSSFIDERVWKKLDSKTRSYLTTAKYTYEILTKADSSLNLDYSGVCMPLTKAVELETSIRFFEGYKSYLAKKYTYNYSYWPREMIDNSKGKTRLITYTLGTFYNIAQNRQGIIYQDFLSYALSKLYTKLNKNDVEKEIRKNCDFVERVRKDYRNPAAHTGAFNRVTAKECFDYIIEVEKMLQGMISKTDF